MTQSLRRGKPEEKKEKKMKSFASQIIGEQEEEDREEVLIPSNAKKVEVVSADTTTMRDHEDKKDEKVYPEPLMTPGLALVAPDVTPEATKPIEPTEVPRPIIPTSQPSQPVSATMEPTREPASNALATMLGMRAESVNVVAQPSSVSLPAGIPSISSFASSETSGSVPTSDIQPAAPPVERDIKPLMEVYRRYVR
jgi:hypothetical protein